MGLHDIPPLFEGITRLHSYYITFLVFLVILTIISKIIHSSTGLAFVALRDSREFATALGVNEYKEKIKVFALVSFLTGIVGWNHLREQLAAATCPPMWYRHRRPPQANPG